MFEKETNAYKEKHILKEEYVKTGAKCVSYDVSIDDAFKDGAEYGYRKAMAEMKAAYDENENFEAWFEDCFDKVRTCKNCKHYSVPYELCCYSMGDDEYDCRGRNWELKEEK